MLWKIIAPIVCAAVLGTPTSPVSFGHQAGARGLPEVNGIPIVCLPRDPVVTYGSGTSVTVTLDGAQNHPVTVYLNSSNSSMLSVPSSITIPAYSDHASCDITGIGTNARAKAGTGVSVLITAYANGGYAVGYVLVI